MASRWDLEEYYDRVVAFVDGRQIEDIPREEIWSFIGMKESRKSFPSEAALRLVCMYELHRMREDPEYAQSVEVRSLRNLWYDVVKPYLNRVERERDILAPKWGRYRSQTLSKVLSGMVLSGMCRYRDFHIEDRSRPNKRPSNWNKFEVGRFDEVVLFIEKDSQFPRIEGLADLLGFTVECGKGQQATSAIEGLIDYLEEGKSYLIFTVTDWDYYGHLINKSMTERVDILGLDAEFVRVGVDVDQIPEERIRVARFLLPMSSDAEREWAHRNAIEGRYGLEIEALTARELRKIIAQAVYLYCEPRDLYDFLMERALNGMVSDVTDLLLGEDNKIQGLLEEIEKLQEELSELRSKLREIIEPLADRFFDERLDELDTREAFPYEWLESRIIEPKTQTRFVNGKPVQVAYLDHQEFTDTDEVMERLVEMVREEYQKEEY